MAAGLRRIDPERLPRLRAAAQLLHRPAAATDLADVARTVAGVQGQDNYAARLAFRSRVRGITAADVDRARSEERSLLRTWLMRMTIHVIPTEDAGWMLPLFEPRMERWTRRRLEQLGMRARNVERALGVVKATLEREGTVTRVEMRDRILAAGIELDSQTRHHIIGLAVTSGLACLGPDRGRTPMLVRREDWLGKLPRFDRETALAELARRYLGGFGPASDHDLAYWSGLPLGEVRQGLAAIAGELEEVSAGEVTLLDLGNARRRAPRAGQLRMLGGFDNYMLGYRNRDFAVPTGADAVVKEGGGGWIRAVVVEDGRLIGGWSTRRPGGRLEIRLKTLRPLSAAQRKAVDAEVADITRFEGLPVSLVEDRAG